VKKCFHDTSPTNINTLTFYTDKRENKESKAKETIRFSCCERRMIWCLHHRYMGLAERGFVFSTWKSNFLDPDRLQIAKRKKYQRAREAESVRKRVKIARFHCPVLPNKCGPSYVAGWKRRGWVPVKGWCECWGGLISFSPFGIRCF
jgi:hypothetical protein